MYVCLSGIKKCYLFVIFCVEWSLTYLCNHRLISRKCSQLFLKFLNSSQHKQWSFALNIFFSECNNFNWKLKLSFESVFLGAWVSYRFFSLMGNPWKIVYRTRQKTTFFKTWLILSVQSKTLKVKNATPNVPMNMNIKIRPCSFS